MLMWPIRSPPCIDEFNLRSNKYIAVLPLLLDMQHVRTPRTQTHTQTDHKYISKHRSNRSNRIPKCLQINNIFWFFLSIETYRISHSNHSCPFNTRRWWWRCFYAWFRLSWIAFNTLRCVHCCVLSRLLSLYFGAPKNEMNWNEEEKKTPPHSIRWAAHFVLLCSHVCTLDWLRHAV